MKITNIKWKLGPNVIDEIIEIIAELDEKEEYEKIAEMLDFPEELYKKFNWAAKRNLIYDRYENESEEEIIKVLKLPTEYEYPIEDEDSRYYDYLDVMGWLEEDLMLDESAYTIRDFETDNETVEVSKARTKARGKKHGKYFKPNVSIRFCTKREISISIDQLDEINFKSNIKKKKWHEKSLFLQALLNKITTEEIEKLLLNSEKKLIEKGGLDEKWLK